MFGKRYVNTANSVGVVVGVATAEVISNMVAGKPYQFAANVNCWIKQGPTTTVTAVVGANANVYVPAGTIVDINGALGNALAVIADSGAGKGSISPVYEM